MFKHALVFFIFAALSASALAYSISGHILGSVGAFPPPYVIAVPSTMDTFYFAFANPIQGYAYTILGPGPGSYFLFSFRDLNINLMPDLDEPRGFYGGMPPQLLQLSSDTSNVDIEILPSNTGGFSGAITYNGSASGGTFVIAHRQPDFSDLPHGVGLLLDGLSIDPTGNGPYTAFVDSFGVYYAFAYMDVNGNYLHDTDEPYGVFGGSTPQTINVIQGNLPDNINIVLEDPAAASFRPAFVTTVSTLGEAYPNPFNATTVLPFRLVEAGDIQLVLQDILGRNIEILVSGFYPAGNFQVIINADNRPSGTYFVSLQAGGVNSVRRVLLLK